MGSTTTIWRGQSVTLTIGNIQDATTANKHISKYVFYSNNTDLTGVGELTNASTVVHANTSVNSEKKYPITSYLLYSHKFDGGTAYATSNKVDNTLIVHEPLDATSLKNIAIKNTDLNNGNWVWSNATKATFAIIPEFASNQPWSKSGIITSDSTTSTNKRGYTSTLNSEDIGTNNKLNWFKTTGNSTDLGEAYQTITVFVQSIEDSAPTPGRIAGRTATFQVRNAVTGLSGLTDKTLYAGSNIVRVPIQITPEKPYSDELVLVNENEQDKEYTTIKSSGGAIVELGKRYILFNASGVSTTAGKQTIKFKVRSKQSNAVVDTEFITFTVNAVANITDKTVVEGESITVAAGIGDITSAEVTSGPVRVTHSKGNVTITGTAVDANTKWVVTVKNADGAKITISGTTTCLADVSTSINTGDYIIVGTELLTGLGEKISKIVMQPSKGKASIEDGKLKYEAYASNSPIDPNTYKITVEGVNGATRTVNIVVRNITASLN